MSLDTAPCPSFLPTCSKTFVMPLPGVLEQVAAEVELEALVGHRHAAPAEVAPGLDDGDLPSLLGEQRGRGQAGGAGADDDDVDLGHRWAILSSASPRDARLEFQRKTGSGSA